MAIKKFNHNKFKNTGLLFELLVTKITTEVINNNKENNALKIMKKYFKQNSFLSEEFALYKSLLESTEISNKNIVHDLINKVIEHRNKIDIDKLNIEKYKLINSIKKYYVLDEFFQLRVKNYKEFATIYKLFEYNLDDNPSEYSKLKNTILELKVNDEKTALEKIQENLKDNLPEDKDIRILAYKIMIKKFNERYNSLDEDQKRILKHYIKKVTNSKELTEFFKQELNNIIGKLNSKAIENEVLNVKVNEIKHLFENMQNKYIVNDKDVIIIMNGYELLKYI